MDEVKPELKLALHQEVPPSSLWMAVDTLTDAARYLRMQSGSIYDPIFKANCKAREILYDALSKVLDEVRE